MLAVLPALLSNLHDAPFVSATASVVAASVLRLSSCSCGSFISFFISWSGCSSCSCSCSCSCSSSSSMRAAMSPFFVAAVGASGVTLPFFSMPTSGAPLPGFLSSCGSCQGERDRGQRKSHCSRQAGRHNYWIVNSTCCKYLPACNYTTAACLCLASWPYILRSYLHPSHQATRAFLLPAPWTILYPRPFRARCASCRPNDCDIPRPGSR